MNINPRIYTHHGRNLLKCTRKTKITTNFKRICTIICLIKATDSTQNNRQFIVENTAIAWARHLKKGQKIIVTLQGLAIMEELQM